MTYQQTPGDGSQALEGNQALWREQGYGVIDPGTGALEVTVNTGTLDASDTLSVASGDAYVDGSVVSVASQNVGINSVSSVTGNTAIRFDTIWVDSTGTVQKEEGTVVQLSNAEETAGTYRFDAVTPKMPHPSTTPAVVLGTVVVTEDDGSVTASMVQDRRLDAGVSVESVTAESGTLGSLDAENLVNYRYVSNDEDGQGVVENATSGDVLVFEPGSTHDVSPPLSVPNGAALVGSGSRNNPTVEFQATGTGGGTLVEVDSGTYVSNIRFNNNGNDIDGVRFIAGASVNRWQDFEVFGGSTSDGMVFVNHFFNHFSDFRVTSGRDDLRIAANSKGGHPSQNVYDGYVLLNGGAKKNARAGIHIEVDNIDHNERFGGVVTISGHEVGIWNQCPEVRNMQFNGSIVNIKGPALLLDQTVSGGTSEIHGANISVNTNDIATDPTNSGPLNSGGTRNVGVFHTQGGAQADMSVSGKVKIATPPDTLLSDYADTGFNIHFEDFHTDGAYGSGVVHDGQFTTVTFEDSRGVRDTVDGPGSGVYVTNGLSERGILSYRNGGVFDMVADTYHVRGLRSSTPEAEINVSASNILYLDDGTNTGDANPHWRLSTDGGTSYSDL